MSKERSRHHDDPIFAPSATAAAGTPGRLMRTALHRNSAPAPAAAEPGAESEPVEESSVLIAHDVPIVVQRFSFDSAISMGGTSTGGGGGQPLPTSWHEDDEETKKRREQKKKQKKHGFGPGRE